MPIQPTLPVIVLGLFVLGLLGAIGLTWLVALVRFVTRQPILPDRPVRRVPWGLFSIVALIIVYAGVQGAAVGMFVTYKVATKKAARPINQAGPAQPGPTVKGAPAGVSDADKMVMMAVLSLFLIPIVPMTLRATCRAGWADLGLSPFRLTDVAYGMLGCLFILPITTFVMTLVSRLTKPTPHQLIEALKGDSSGRMMLLAMLTAVVAAPIVEEMFFRGVLLGWLTKLVEPRPFDDFAFEELTSFELQAGTGLAIEPGAERENPYLAPEATLGDPLRSPGIGEFEPSPMSGRGALADLPFAWMIPNVMTSLVFAGLHFEQWPAPIPLFLLSLMLGYLYRRTGSLFAPMAMHATFNGINMTFLLLALWSGLPISPAPEKPPIVEPIEACVPVETVKLTDSWNPGIGEEFPLATRGRTDRITSPFHYWCRAVGVTSRNASMQMEAQPRNRSESRFREIRCG